MLLLALAVAPALFWLWYFLRRDHLRPEPRHLVRRVFFLGAAAALVAAVVELGVFAAIREALRPDLSGILISAGLIGVIEEGVKLAAVFYGVYRHAEFNEVFDGIVYAVAASLGFATLENILYVVQGGAGVGVARAFLSVPGHAFFGALMGFSLGMAKFSGRQETKWLIRGLIVASLAHAAYDAVLLTRTLIALTVIPIVLALWMRAVRHVRHALALDEQRFGAAPDGPGDQTREAGTPSDVSRMS